MAFFGNVRLEAEPFEESQGAESPKSVASPDELKAFYSVMEKQETVQRKLSRRKSGSSRSLFSRKPAPMNPPPQTVAEIKTLDREKEPESEHVEEKDQPPLMRLQSRSIIPDQLQELPAWYNKEDWAGVPIPSQKMWYPIHNPIGPRRYINHHLLRSFRSPSIFSPSFPPMASTVQEASQDSARIPGPSRTPSGSPLPTPSSSDTRIADNGRRSRKTSQTAHDTVDLLDLSDPWGTNWHHQSPYDIGLNTSPVSPDEIASQARSRVASVTTGQRRRTMPSPLSQSTSAIHLQAQDTTTSRVTQKLSKRRKPLLGSLFGHGNSVENTEPKAVSLPATPIEHLSQPASEEPPLQDNASKRNSTLRQSMITPPSVLVSVDKKAKRGSALGRLAKRFSIMRKPIQEPMGELTGRDSDDWHHVGVKDTHSDRDSRHSAQLARQPSPEKLQADPEKIIDPIKRIPPPSAQSGVADRSSAISVEATYSMGRLTIANPDTQSDVANTPVQHNNVPLPPDSQSKPAPENQRRPSEDKSQNTSLPATSPGTSSDSPLDQPSNNFASAPQPDVDKPQQSSADSVEISQPADYRISKQLPDPSPSPTQLYLDFTELLRSPAQTEEHKPIADPGLSVSRSTQSPVECADGLQHAANTRESKRAQHPPGPTSQPQDSTNVSPVAPPVPESRTSKSGFGSTQTQLPAECTTESARSRSVASPPVAAEVPFPFRVELLPSIPAFDPIRLSAASIVVDSPLSTASMFVHPPTPHDSPALMPMYAPPLPPKAPLDDKRSAPPVISPTKVKNESFGSGRQTETFKLVRSASGNLYPMGNTIIAAGQQWEVVESDVSHRGKTREKSKSKVSGSKDRGSKELESREKESRERARERETRGRETRGKETRDNREMRDREGKDREARDRDRETRDRETRNRETRDREVRDREARDRDREARDREARDREARDREARDRETRERDRGLRETRERPPRDRDRREHRRQDRSKADADADADHRASRQRNGRLPENSVSASSSSGHPRARSVDIHHRPETQDHGEHKSSRRRDEDKERRSERNSEVVKPSKLDVSKPQPLLSQPTPGPPAPAKLERRPSTSNRPTSELPSTAELNSLRARDVWEMDRLWKGRSMYGAEPNGLAVPTTEEVRPTTESRDNNSPVDGPSHGSSHTSFVVQSPFQTSPSSSNPYHSMPSGPPAIIYAAPSSVPQSFYHPAVQNYANHHSFPSSISQDPTLGSSPPQLPNPLPEPPRESPYTPSTLLDAKGGRSADYWTKHAGATKAH